MERCRKLDEVDYKLITEIHESPRESYRRIARHLGISESTAITVVADAAR